MSEDEAHAAAGAAIERARAGGLETLHCWVADGTLISSEEFAHRRGWTTLQLHQARGKGRVFSLLVRGRCRYAAALAALPERYMLDLVGALDGLATSQRLLFVIRGHGALGGRTVLSAFENGAGDHVLDLARAWADERGDT